MATATEIRAYWQKAYTEELIARLAEKAEDGDLSTVVDEDDFIDGGLLGGVDETATVATRREFGWRDDDAAIAAALEQPDCYEGIDYGAIIAAARKRERKREAVTA